MSVGWLDMLDLTLFLQPSYFFSHLLLLSVVSSPALAEVLDLNHQLLNAAEFKTFPHVKDFTFLNRHQVAEADDLLPQFE